MAKNNNLLKEGYELVQSERNSTLESTCSISNDIDKIILGKNLRKVLISKNSSSSIFLDFNKDYDENVLFLTNTGKCINESFAKSIYESISAIIVKAKHSDSEYEHSDTSVGDYIYEEFSKSIVDRFPDRLKPILDGLFLMRAKRENIASGTHNLFDLSLKNFKCWKEFEGEPYVELKHGYKPIIDLIIGGHQQDFNSKVYLNHHLKQIYLCQKLAGEAMTCKKCFHCQFTNDANKAVLRMCNTTNSQMPVDLIIICDKVISTTSLGYLKENLNTFINPLSLISNEKRLSILKLGFGTINKVFLFYQEPFWPQNTTLINMVWLPRDSNFRLDKMIYRNSNKRIWIEDICKFEVVNSYPNALCAWIAGSEDFERLDDNTIANECTILLRMFMNNKQVPEPLSIQR